MKENKFKDALIWRINILKECIHEQSPKGYDGWFLFWKWTDLMNEFHSFDQMDLLDQSFREVFINEMYDILGDITL